MISQIIGIDKTKDQITISSICSNCKTVIELKQMVGDRNLDVTFFNKCPNCNMDIDFYKVFQE